MTACLHDFIVKVGKFTGRRMASKHHSSVEVAVVSINVLLNCRSTSYLMSARGTDLLTVVRRFGSNVSVWRIESAAEIEGSRSSSAVVQSFVVAVPATDSSIAFQKYDWPLLAKRASWSLTWETTVRRSGSTQDCIIAISISKSDVLTKVF